MSNNCHPLFLKFMKLKRINFGYLLAGLLVLLLSVALAQEEGVGREGRSLFFAISLHHAPDGRMDPRQEKKVRIIGGIIAAIGVAAATIHFFLDIPGLKFVNAGIMLVFSLVSTWMFIAICSFQDQST